MELYYLWWTQPYILKTVIAIATIQVFVFKY